MGRSSDGLGDGEGRAGKKMILIRAAAVASFFSICVCVCVCGGVGLCMMRQGVVGGGAGGGGLGGCCTVYGSFYYLCEGRKAGLSEGRGAAAVGKDWTGLKDWRSGGGYSIL